MIQGFHARNIAIDAAHDSDLLRLLLEVKLIYANCINSKQAYCTIKAQLQNADFKFSVT
jgi:hypothetical protein